jgi:hypothetical protein
MLSKHLGTAIIVAFVSISFAGCSSDDNAASSKSSISESHAETIIPKTLEERKQPTRLDVSGIDVSKEEMDKLIPYAKSRQWSEGDVRYVVALLKLCGVDFRRMDEHGRLHNLPGEITFSCSLSMEGEKNSNGEYCVHSIYLEKADEFAKDQDRIFIHIREFDLLRLQEINPKADNLFVKLDKLEQMKSKITDALRDKAITTPSIEDIWITARGDFNGNKRTVIFRNEIQVYVTYDIKTNVYGGKPVRTSSTITFDFDGNIKNIENKKIIT